MNLLIGVCAVVFVAHLPALSTQAKFLDDRLYVAENPLVQNPSWASTRRFFTEILRPSTVRGYYQPLTMTSLMIDYAAAERTHNLMPFHRTSLLLHVANAGLVVYLLYLLFGRVWIAAGAGLLFGLHPIAVESVCWVSERKTVLATFFALWSLILYVRFSHKVDWRSYSACLFMYVLALLSKPTATPLPLMMMLMDYWPLRRIKAKAVLEKLPLFAIGAVFSVIAFVSQSRTSMAVLPGQYNPLHISLIFCHNIIFYLYKLFWPVALSAHYEHPGSVGLSNPMVLAGIIGTSILVPLLLISLRWTRALVTGWLIFFTAILPTMGIVRVTYVLVANRYVYLPSVGLLMVLASMLAWFLSETSGEKRRIARQLLVAVTLLMVAGAEAAAMRRYLHHWHDTVSLYEYMLTINPDSPRLHSNLAVVLSLQGKGHEAIDHYRQALRTAPNVAHAHFNLGVELAKSPNKIDQAIEQLCKALEFAPSFFEAHLILGRILQSEDRLDDAIRHFRRAVQISPEDARGRYSLGGALALTDRPTEAIQHLRKAVRLNPVDLLPLKELAWLLATHSDPNVRDADEALRLAESASKLTKNRNAEVLGILAAAYAARGQFALGVAVAQKAAKLASDAQDEELASQIHGRLELYKREKPWWEDQAQDGTSLAGPDVVKN